MNWKHVVACVALVVAGIAVALAGAESLGLVVALVCPLMMGAMVWMMVRTGDRGH